MLEHSLCVGEWIRIFTAPEFVPVIACFVFYFGACFGSFLNVCIYRMPRGESVVTTPSHCPSCNTLISPYDNVPVFAYLFLRGKCRKCSWPIPFRYLGMELALGALFLLAYFKVIYGNTNLLLWPLNCAMLWMAVGAIFIDWKSRIIPNGITYPWIIFGILWSLFFPQIWTGFITEYFAYYGALRGVYMASFSLFVPFVVFVIFRGLGYLFAHREVLGWGDIKMMCAVGACLGLVALFNILVVASCLSIFFILYVYFLRKVRGRLHPKIPAIPFGTMLGIAILIVVFAMRFFPVL